MKNNESRTLVYTECFIIDVQPTDGGVSVTAWERKPNEEFETSRMVENFVLINKDVHPVRLIGG